MKKIILILCLFIISCDDSTTDTSSSDDAVALIWMSTRDDSYDLGCDSLYNRLYFQFPVMGSEIPSINSLIVNQNALIEVSEFEMGWSNEENLLDSISTDLICENDGGGFFAANFSYGYSYGDASYYSQPQNLEQINLRLNLNESTLTATINKPEPIDSSQCTLLDSGNFNVSWNNTGADFYAISIDGYCSDDYIYFNDTFFTRANTYTIEIPCDNPYIYGIFIRSMNGPFPQDGSIPNMDGGNGFLYYDSSSIEACNYYYSSSMNGQIEFNNKFDKPVRKVLESLELD